MRPSILLAAVTAMTLVAAPLVAGTSAANSAATTKPEKPQKPANKPAAKTTPKPKPETAKTIELTPTKPINAAACPKLGSTAPTPSTPDCGDTHSGIHEGGPFGH